MQGKGTEEPRTGLHYIPFHLSRRRRPDKKKGVDGERIVDAYMYMYTSINGSY